MFERLFPDQGKFFAEFAQIAGKLTDAASLLERGFEEPEKWPELVASIHEIQRAVDVEAHAFDLNIERLLIPPLDREDIHLLATGLRSVVDIIGGEAGDAISRDAISDLFVGNPNPLDVIRWKTLYEQLEEALDAGEDVANELETITLKHTVS